jgi:predicted ChrR family anti-sigma factor
LNYNTAIRATTDGHPLDALIAGYAANTLSTPLTALVAAHLELNPENRAYAAALEAVYGVFLEELRPVPLAGRDRRLVNIFASPDPAPKPTAPARRAAEGSSVLPQPLRRLAGCDLADLAWAKRSSGIKEAPLRDAADVARFVSVRPGQHLPVTGDDGLTAVLVLAGCVGGRNGNHRRGDIVLVGRDADMDDEPVAKGDRDCICFVVVESSAKGPAAHFSG